MAVPLPEKKKKRKAHKEPVSSRLAVLILAFFSFGLVCYLAASYRQPSIPLQVIGGVPGASITAEGEGAGEMKSGGLEKFSSQDDFKSYLDSGRRAAAAGPFESEKAALAAKDEESAKAKPAGKVFAPAVSEIASAAAGRFFSLGEAFAKSAGDIIRLDEGKLYFSPNNQFYWPKSAAASRPAGETKIFETRPAGGMKQVGAIPQDGNFLVLDGSLAVFLNNSLAVYDLSFADSPLEIWQGRLNGGSRIIASEFAAGKLYLAVETEIDPANPCPIKPLVIGETPVSVECASIYRPAAPLAADSVFTIFEMNPRSGTVVRDFSVVAPKDGFSMILESGTAWIAWNEEQDHIDFFADFLNTKCRGLLPNYIAEKTRSTADCEISRAGKEFETRRLLAGWFDSLAQDEKERIAGEVSLRLADYLRDQTKYFERTGIVKINLETFAPEAQTAVAGRLPEGGFVPAAGELRAVTVSGFGAAQKMEWLVSGNIAGQENERAQNNIYLLDKNLKTVAEARNLDIPAGICALRFSGNAAYARVCRAGEPLYALSFNPQAAGLAGKFSLPAEDAYFYPLNEISAIAVYPNARKIKVALFDSSLPGRIEKIHEYALNDYWADFEANIAAFAHDPENKRLFLPGARGGNILSYAGSEIALAGSAGEIAPARAFFEKSDLYIAGDAGIEVFGGADFEKINSVEF
ncbi:MAG: beta-propeller domain-containing protein [Minisyncoccales bacterium]